MSCGRTQARPALAANGAVMADDGALDTAAEQVAVPTPTARSILLGSGPRFARDAFLPILVFYVLWRTLGLAAGIAGATIVSLVAWRLEVRAERPGIMARVSLGFVLLQAAIGLAAHSATVYLAQPVLLNA